MLEVQVRARRDHLNLIFLSNDWSSSNDWCYLESYEWQGYDFHRYDPDACSSGDPEYDHPDCFKEGFDQDVLSQDMMRLSTIYPRETVSPLLEPDSPPSQADLRNSSSAMSAL